MKQIYKIKLIGIIVGLCSMVYATGQEFKVIVNSSNPVTSLTKKQVSAYMLKQKTRWADKTKVMPIDLSSRSSVRAQFTKKIHKKSISQVRAYWQQSVFSGKASPPSEKGNDIAVINYVKAHSGAIGYISVNAKTTGVKTIKVN